MNEFIYKIIFLEDGIDEILDLTADVFLYDIVDMLLQRNKQFQRCVLYREILRLEYTGISKALTVPPVP